MERRSPKSAGRCERWLPSKQYACGKSARYIVFETRALCKSCYAVYKRTDGRGLAFEYKPELTAEQKWKERALLAREIDGAHVRDQRKAIRASFTALVAAELEAALQREKD